MDRQEQRLTLREAAQALGISEVSARRWIKSGKLRAYQPGRSYQIPVEAVEELLGDGPKAPAPFSLEWARAADDAEFYKAIVEAPEEDIDKLDLLSATMQRLSHWELMKAASEDGKHSNKPPAPESRPDAPPVSPQEWPILTARADAVTKEVKRRRPPFARVKQWAPWIGRTAEVRWLIPPDQWDQYRGKVEEMLDDPTDYLDVDARVETEEYKETPLYA